MAQETNYNDNLTLDEIVFEKRNKEYGAYDLRHRYPKILTKAFLLGTLLFVLLVVTPFVVMKIKQMAEANKTEVDAKLLEVLQEDKIIETPKEEEPPPPPPPKVEPPKQEVIQNVVPEPKKAPKVETPPPPISEQLKTTTGLKDQEGTRTPTYAPPPPPPTTGKAATMETKPAIDEKKVYDDVEQQAEFPGGINSFRSKVESNFDTSAMSGDEGTVKTELVFVVERDGSITDIKANGSNRDFNDEAVRTVKSIKNKWAPAKINGQAVRYRFRFPITMRFE